MSGIFHRLRWDRVFVELEEKALGQFQRTPIGLCECIPKETTNVRTLKKENSDNSHINLMGMAAL